MKKWRTGFAHGKAEITEYTGTMDVNNSKKFDHGNHGTEGPGGEILVYQADDGKVRMDVRLESETVWLTQASLAELFQVKPQNITMHLKNIYAEGELAEEATCKEYQLLSSVNEGKG